MKSPAMLLLACLLAVQSAAGAPAGARMKMLLNGPWQAVLTRQRSDEPPESGWQEFHVPGVFHSTSAGGSRYAWLRREVAIPPAWQGKRVFLHLYGARYDAHVYVDGRLMGHRLEGFTPFEVEITQAVAAGGTHRIELRCQDVAATFATLKQLPEDGWDSKELKGQLLAPVGGRWASFGPWDEIALVARPPVYLKDLVIAPSVRKGSLTLTGSVSQVASGMSVRASVLDGDRTVLDLPGRPVRADGSWTLSAPFPNARHWSPEDPHLYRLRVGLSGPDGRTVDELERRFGFKEFWAEGPDFYLNGVKRHLLATSCWPPSRPESMDYVRNAIRFWKDAHCVAFRQHTQPWPKKWTEAADEMGLMMIIEAPMWTDSGRYAYDDPRFWQNYRDALERMVWRSRNNPSVIMWSLENEFLSVGNDRWCPDLENRLADLGRFVKRLDPHHLVFFESDLDPGGVADVIGLHYPHELPEFSDYPNTADWLSRAVQTGTGGGLLGSRKARFFWDRRKPLYIGEFLWVPAEDYSPGSVFFGDEAYINRQGYKRKAQALAWFDQTVAYRRAGVSGMCPWAIGLPGAANREQDLLYSAQKSAYVPVAAFLRERDCRFFCGRTIARTFDIFNDSPQRQELELRWQLDGAGGAERFSLEPGGHRAVTVRVELPKAERPRLCTFRSALIAGGRKVHEQAFTYRVEPLRPVRVPSGVHVLLYDPKRRWHDVLSRAGLNAELLTSLRALDDGGGSGSILIIPPGAWAPARPGGEGARVGREDEGTARLAQFLGAGGRLLVLAQESLEGLPLPASLVPHPSTMTFSLARRHPVLDGVEAADLKFWRGDNYVTRRELVRPGSHGARTIVVSGGRQSLNQGPIVELRAGKGTALLVQALVCEKLDSEPVARRILGNALCYLAQAAPPPGRTLVISDSAEFTGCLRELGVDFAALNRALRPEELESTALIVLHGGGPAISRSAGTIASFLASEGPPKTVYWHAPDPETFESVARALGLGAVKIGPAQGPVTLLSPGVGPLEGVSREDLCFTGPVTDWKRHINLDPSVVDRALVPDIQPGDMERIEASAMSLEGTYVGVARDGRSVTFASSGTGTVQVQRPEAGLYPLWLVAHGTPAGGVWPLASVRVNGTDVVRMSVSSSDTAIYPALARLPAGKAVLTLAYVNDAVIGNEDRNLTVEAILLGRQPWRARGIHPLTQPPALAVLRAGRGRLVVDGVRWDTNATNAVKGRRYASALLANLGASFVPAQPEPTWLPASLFEPVARIAYSTRDEREFGIFSAGEIRAEFTCVAAGSYRLYIRGRSTPAEGVYAKAELSIDGHIVAGEVELRSATARVFEVGVARLTRGNHAVNVRFTNDRQVGREDRNLWVQAVGFRRLRDSP